MSRMTRTEPTIFALFGNPVGHSLSPLMHNAAYQRMRINAHYIPVCVEDLSEAIQGMRRRAMQGASVTIPFKTTVLPLLDQVDDQARQIGAVNTIWRDANDRLNGYNTDWIGLVRCLEDSLEIHGKTFAIVGAGGAARAAVFGIRLQGGIPLIVNRGPARGETLAQEFGCPFYPLAEIGRISADCLINTTPVGMEPDKGKSPIPQEVLKNFPWVMDCVYHPLETQLLREAAQAGCATINGLGMFVHQGAEQIKLWTGEEPPREFMKEVVLKRLQGRDGD
jgi:shikimate dehydrogenase